MSVLLFSGKGFTQAEDLNVKFGRYNIQTKFNPEEYITTLSVLREGKNIFEKKYYDLIPEIKTEDLDGDGRKEILIAMYSGGAHCCTNLFAGKISKGKFIFTDSIYWGNSFFRMEDLNADGKKEFMGVNDVYAYMFTNYAQSRFPVLIYAFENNRFVNVTKNFPEVINESLTELKKELEEYKNFRCEDAGTETFNTDAGAVKAILAAITEEYMSLGKTDEGYKLIDEFYKCPDADNFKDKLRNDFLLK
ncbi:MAG TPA: hypothetical protein PK536_03635 [Ignavibacteria bacterium]|nr:hypothetical protein [Bacteroidota bacterium]HRI84516.1 hypothetical protein [Ignavibacteria bacterium]HRK00584.1 hypothetical protein [Ignavibacteria bacterium]